MTTGTLERIPAEVQADRLTVQVKEMVIATVEDRTQAEDMIQGAKKLEDEIFAFLDPPRAKAYEDYKYHKERLDNAIKPVQDARKAIKQKCIAYDEEQERIRREEQALLDAEARKRAEEEALALASQLEAEGDTEAANEVLTAPLDVAPVFAPKVAPAPSRLSAGRSVWSAEVLNMMALVKAVAEGKQPVSLLMVNQPALNASAKLIKVNGSTAIPGCRVIERKV